MMRRAAAIVVGPILAFLVSAFPASAQPARTNARVWYVYLHEVGPSAPHLDHFRARMAELGWREGRNLTIDYRGAGGDGEKLAAIMREVSASKVDVILAVCTPEAKAALAATQTIPIVFAAAGDAVKAGLVDSYARPGHNVTGFTSSLLELSEKRIELLKEGLPVGPAGGGRLAISSNFDGCWTGKSPGFAPRRVNLKAADALGFRIPEQILVRADEVIR